MSYASLSRPAGQSCQVVRNVEPTPRIGPDQLAHHNDGGEFEDYTPGWDADRYEPTPEALAESDGFSHGYDLDYAALPPDDLGSHLAHHWMMGKIEGVAQKLSDDRERSQFEEERLAWAFAGPAVADDEVVRAIGAVEARKAVRP